MPDYLAIKHLHVSAAGLSLALFVLRGAWRVVSPERLAARWVRVVPHVIDTVLFASALWLAWQVGRGGPLDRGEGRRAARLHRAGLDRAQAGPHARDPGRGVLRRARDLRLHRVGRDRQVSLGRARAPLTPRRTP